MWGGSAGSGGDARPGDASWCAAAWIYPPSRLEIDQKHLKAIGFQAPRPVWRGYSRANSMNRWIGLWLLGLEYLMPQRVELGAIEVAEQRSQESSWRWFLNHVWPERL